MKMSPLIPSLGGGSIASSEQDIMLRHVGAVEQASSVLQTMSSTQQWVTLRWRMRIRPRAILPCLRLQCEKVGLSSARNPRRRDHMGYALSARMGQITVPSGAPSAAPADVVYSIEPLIFILNKLIQTTFICLNVALRLATCAFELVVHPINLLRLLPGDVLGV